MEHWVPIYSNQKKIEYISASNIRAGFETFPLQVHNWICFSPTLPFLTFYGPPPPSYARFCDTRISSSNSNVYKCLVVDRRRLYRVDNTDNSFINRYRWDWHFVLILKGCPSCRESNNSELEQRRFCATHVNRKWSFLDEKDLTSGWCASLKNAFAQAP